MVMLPLPGSSWYEQNPKPLNKSNNLDASLVKTGLRLEEADYNQLRSRLSKCLVEGGLDCAITKVNLAKQEHRNLALSYIKAFRQQEDRRSWDEIGADIVEAYLFEVAKHCIANQKRIAKPETDLPTRSLQDIPTHSAQSSRTSSPSAFLLPPRPNLLAAPVGNLMPSPSFTSSSSIQQPSSTRLPLRDHTFFVARKDAGEPYEDTMDVLLKTASRQIVVELGPNDFDFEVFRAEISNAMAYDPDTENICYSHESQGATLVENPSRWRVALQHLWHRSLDERLRFEIIPKVKPEASRAEPTPLRLASTPQPTIEKLPGSTGQDAGLMNTIG